MMQYCYVIVNNAGHSWPVLAVSESSPGNGSGAPILPQLLQEDWVPIRETPMGGGTSSLAHSLVLLGKDKIEAPAPKRGRRRRREK